MSQPLRPHITTRSDILWEYRSRKARQKDADGNMAPTYIDAKLLWSGTLTGYQSMYGVTKAQAAANIHTGSTRGMDCPVWCDVVFVDFDDRPEDAVKLEKYLINRQVAHAVCDSGNRSVHFHIPIEPLFGEDVPYSIARWLEQHAPGHDPSFPQSRNGMFRLLGTTHEKTGRKKKMLRTFVGRLLDVPYVERGLPQFRLKADIRDRIPDAADALLHVMSVIMNEPLQGNRQQTGLWSPLDGILNCQVTNSQTGQKTALKHAVNDPIAFAEGLLVMINGSWNNPKPYADLQRVLADLKGRQ